MLGIVEAKCVIRSILIGDKLGLRPAFEIVISYLALIG